MKKYGLIVIGAGAAGLTAAACAARFGKSVLIIEKNAEPARKIYVSGGGKCNFSNRRVNGDHYLSANPRFCRSALAGVTPDDVLKRLDDARIGWEEREDGKLFAFSGESIRRFVLNEARAAGAELLTGVALFDLQKSDVFRLTCSAGEFSADAVLIATGGKSCPALGATGIGFSLAEKFGLKVVPPEPALVSLKLASGTAPDLTGLSGVSLPVRIKTGKRGQFGDLLFTPDAVSGPAVLQTSLRWNAGEAVEIDFLPETDLTAVLKTRRLSKEKKHLAAVLSEMMPSRLARRFVGNIEENTPLSAVSDKVFAKLDRTVKHFRFTPPATGGWTKAEVTKGGVDVNGLFSATMESRTVSGLYFAGEVVDVTGEVGGYNLHWAWASGTAAGKAAGARQTL